jgi:hypothetical protein
MRVQHIPAGCPRPKWFILVNAMEKLSRPKRTEICRLGRRARAAREPRLRRLAREARAEAVRLAAEAGR